MSGILIKWVDSNGSTLELDTNNMALRINAEPLARFHISPAQSSRLREELRRAEREKAHEEDGEDA